MTAKISGSRCVACAGRRGRTCRRADPSQFLSDDTQLDKPHSQTPVLFGDPERGPAKLNHLHPQGTGVTGALVDTTHDRSGALTGKHGPDIVPQINLIVAQFQVHGSAEFGAVDPDKTDHLPWVTT